MIRSDINNQEEKKVGKPPMKSIPIKNSDADSIIKHSESQNKLPTISIQKGDKKLIKVDQIKTLV
jgi:hypothetical protein